VSYRGPVLLEASQDVADFQCGNDALDQWLKARALSNHLSGTSRTWVVIEETERRVVGYYASSTASVLRQLASGPIRRNQPEEIPAILLGRMAVDERHQSSGLGAAMLKHLILKVGEVSKIVGVRVILVHAKDERARAFYLHAGFFLSSTFDPLTLLLRNPLE